MFHLWNSQKLVCPPPKKKKHPKQINSFCLNFPSLRLPCEIINMFKVQYKLKYHLRTHSMGPQEIIIYNAMNHSDALWIYKETLVAGTMITITMTNLKIPNKLIHYNTNANLPSNYYHNTDNTCINNLHVYIVISLIIQQLGI